MGRYGYNDLESEFFGLSEIVSTEYHLIYVISLHQRPLTSWVFRSCFNSIEYVGETITFVLVFRFKFDFMRERETAAIHRTKGLQNASIINCIYIPRVFNYYLVTKNWFKSRYHGQGPVGC